MFNTYTYGYNSFMMLNINRKKAPTFTAKVRVKGRVYFGDTAAFDSNALCRHHREENQT